MYPPKYISVLVFLLMFWGCYPDTEETIETIIIPVRKTIIASAQVVVHVTDENGQTLTGLTARFNQQSKIINQASFFQFDAQNIHKEGELLTVTDQDGQMYEFALYNIENQVNYHSVSLFRGALKKDFSSSEGSVISFPSGKMNIDLTKGGFTAGDQSYAGPVQCIYHEYDLNNPYHVRALPGGKLLDINGKYRLVDGLYAFRFDLLTPNEKILTLTQPQKVSVDISPEKPARVIQYDRSSQSWTDLGAFSESQQITVQTSGIYAIVYVHEPAILKGVLTANQWPLVNQRMTYEYEDKIYHTQTTNEGKWEVWVPQNTQINVKPVTDCSDLDKSKTISVLENTLDAGILNYQTSQIKAITIKGSFKNCYAEALPDGFIHIKQNTIYHNIYIPKSDFEWTIPVCAESPLSFGAAGHSGEKMSDIGFDNDTADLGVIFLCPGLENQYISLRTPEGNTLYTGDIIVSFTGSDTYIQFKSTTQEFLLVFQDTQKPGFIPSETGNIVWKDPTFLAKGIEIHCPTSNTCGFEEIHVLSQQQDNWIKGSFKGRFWSKTLQPLTARNQVLEGDFFIKN